jgi:predicted nucleic-acid-binding Zn-ribbon protein
MTDESNSCPTLDQHKVKFTNYKLVPMTGEEEEFQLCPNCKVGRLRPTELAATSSDPQTNRATNDFRGYKCDSCGYPEGGQAKVVAANEQAAISESTDTTTTTSSPAATTAAVQSAIEAVGAAAEEDTDKGKEGTEEEASYITGSPSGGSSMENPA